MGSAVSAVSGAGLGGIGGVSGPIAGQTGGVLGGVTSGLVGNIGQVPVANQQALQNQIAQSNLNAAGAGATATQQYNQAQGSLANTENAINQSQNAINTAQQTASGGDVANALALLQAQANGTAPSAAQAVLQSGKNAAIAQQEAMANSGNLSQMISGQKTAMDNAANLTQQSANQATQLQAQQQQAGQINFANAAQAQAAQQAQNAALQQQQAAQQAGLYGTQLGSALNYNAQGITASGQALSGAQGGLGIQQGALTATGQNQAAAMGGLLNAGGGIAAAGASDENLKTNIRPANSQAKAKSISDSFGTKSDSSDSSSSDSSDDSKPEEKQRGYWADSGSQKSSEDISASFSDKNGKKDIKKEDKVSKFLDAIDPVTFEYKKADGQMGRTPGEHIGIIAQQVEKAPGGKSMVVDTPIGKGIDLASAVGTLLAAAAETHDRVKQLEDLFNSRKKK